MASNSASTQVDISEDIHTHEQTTERPIEQLEVSEDANSQDNIVYPTGVKLWMSILSLILTVTFIGLDMTIVAVAVPSLTNQFNTVEDIGWYASTYMLFNSSFTLFFSRLCTVYDVKRVYLAAIGLFQLGSLLCTIAPVSAVFILGRAVAGFGGAGIGTSAMTIITYTFPLQKRPLWSAIIGVVQIVAMVAAPLVGGALIDGFSWRACFGINLPVGALAFVLTAYYFHNPIVNPDTKLPFKEKVKKMDLLGTLFFVPGMVCLLIGLQWGGTRYSWADVKVIILLVMFAILVSIFGYIQYRNQDRATLPPRVLKQRSVIAGACFSACCSGILAVTENYIAIYFQGVKGFSAMKSGALVLPMIIGIGISTLVAGVLTSLVGYYHPFMLATSVMAPIAAGLLTTLDIDASLVKVLCVLGLLGTAVGLGLQGPITAVQTILTPSDVPIGLAINGFAGGIGSGFFVSVSATLFQNRLATEISNHAPGTNITTFEGGGLTDIRKYVGSDRLRDILLGYDSAIMQTFYLPLALALLTLGSSLAMERKSVKEKRS